MTENVHERAGMARPSPATARRVRAGPTACLTALLTLGVVQPSGAQQVPVQFSGQVRLRPEWDDRTAVTGADAAVLIRTRLGIQATLSRSVGVFIQLQDSRAFGEETSPLADGSADRLDLHQAYIELSAEAGPAAVRATAGRQELTLANERLLGPVDWSNTGQAFDGLRVQVTGPRERVRLIGFAAVVREYDRVAATGLDPRANEGEDRDHGFFGLIVEAPRAQLFLLHDRNAAYRSFTGVDRTTVGARAERTLAGRVRLEAEGAYQLGNQLALGGVGPKQDIGAWFGGGRIAWLQPVRPLGSVSIGVDWLSGDADPGDVEYEAFHVLYGTNHRFYGFMDLFLDPAAQTGDRGLVDGMGEIAVRLRRDFTVSAVLHRFQVAERAGAAERTLGSELDLTVPYTVARGTTLQAGYSYFRTGAAAPLATLGARGANLHWAYLQLQATF